MPRNVLESFIRPDDVFDSHTPILFDRIPPSTDAFFVEGSVKYPSGRKTGKSENGMKFLTKRHTAATMLYLGERRWFRHRAGSRPRANRRRGDNDAHPDAVLDPKVAASRAWWVRRAAVRGAEAGAAARRADDGPDGDDVGVRLRGADGELPGGPGVSGHLLGGVLAAVLLGPWAGAVVIAAVLIVQCFLFSDGGVTALGANFVNMGLIGAVGGYAIYAPIRRAIARPEGDVDRRDGRRRGSRCCWPPGRSRSSWRPRGERPISSRCCAGWRWCIR